MGLFPPSAFSLFHPRFHLTRPRIRTHLHSAKVVGGMAADPNDPDRIFYVAGSTVVYGHLGKTGGQSFLRGHDDDITCLAVSPSGTLIATGQEGVNADVVLWDATTGKEKFRLSEHDEGVACLAFSPDDRLLISCGIHADGKIFAWDTETGCIVANGALAPRETNAIAFAPKIQRNGTYYTFGTVGKEEVVIWGCDAGRGLIGGQKCGTGNTKRYFTSCVFSGDSQELYAGSKSGDISTFNVQGCVLRNWSPCCKGAAQVFMPVDNGRYYLVGGGDGSVGVFNPHKPPTVLDALDYVWEFEGGVTSMSTVNDDDFTRGNPKMVVCTSAGRKYVTYVKRRKANVANPQPRLLEESHVDAISLVQFAPMDADFGDQGPKAHANSCMQAVVSCGADGALKAWNLNPRPVCTMRAKVKSTAMAPMCVCVCDQMFMTGWEDGHVRAHDNVTGELLWTLPDAHAQGGVTSIAVAHGAHFFATGGAEGMVRIWDMLKRQLVSTFKEHRNRVVGLTVLKDDLHVVSASRDRSIITWDLVRECRVHQQTQHVGGINACVINQSNPDAMQMVSVGQDRSLSFWDLMDRDPLQIVKGAHSQECTCADLSSQGILATGSKDQTVKLWDFNTGRLLAAQHAHCGAVSSVTFSADGKSLVSGGEDGIIMVWSVRVDR